jgi:hypothetical protein
MGQPSGGSTTTVQQQLAPEQQDILAAIMPTIQQYANQTPQPYPGPTLAGFTPAQIAGQAAITNQAQGQTGASTNQALQGLDFFTSGAAMDPTRNPGLSGAIEAAINPIRSEYQNTVLPGITSGAVNAGMFGEGRQGVAEGLASDAYLRNVANATANVVNPAYQTGLETTGRALAFAPAVLQAGYGPGSALSAVGGQQQAQGQAEINADINRYIQEQYLPLMLAREIAGLAFGLPIGGTVTQSQGPGTSPFAGALGGAASGAAMGTMVMPGWGTAGGAIIGGLMGLLGGM